VSKKPGQRPVETTHVLRHVDLHHAPHTLKARSEKLSRLGSEKGPIAHSAILTTAGRDVLSTPKIPDPQWQAGHQQGYAEGRQAGLEEAKRELLDQQTREGFEQGYEEGLAQARQQLEKESVALREKLQNAFDKAVAEANQDCIQTSRRFEQLMQRVPEQLSARMANMEDDMVELCFAMVCRILGDQLTTPAGIRAMLCQATKDWPADADLTIHLHPDDLQRLRSATADDFVDSSRANMLDHLTADLERRVRPPLQWIADASLGVGGCVLRSSKGGLDARLMVQMKALQDALLGVRALRRDLRYPMDQATELKIADLPDPVNGVLSTKNKGAQP
jgi:flagellar assembly protein FliH